VKPNSNNKSLWFLGIALLGMGGLCAVGSLVVGVGLSWMLKSHSLTYQRSLSEVMTGQSTIEPLGGIEMRPGRILREVREPVDGLTRVEVEYEIHGPRQSAIITAHAFENDSDVLGYQKFVVRFADGTSLDFCEGSTTTLEEAKAEAAKPKPRGAVSRT
jgi:hypothetical protein